MIRFSSVSCTKYLSCTNFSNCTNCDLLATYFVSSLFISLMPVISSRVMGSIAFRSSLMS